MDVEQFISDWNSGVSKNDLISKYGFKHEKAMYKKLARLRKKNKNVSVRYFPKLKRNERIVLAYNKGASIKNIAKRYGLSEITTRHYISYLRKQGANVKYRYSISNKSNKINIENVVQDWNNGMSNVEIAKKYKTYSTYICFLKKKARENGIQLREINRHTQTKGKVFIKQIHIDFSNDWNNGLSIKQISAKYNIPANTAYHLYHYCLKNKMVNKACHSRKKILSVNCGLPQEIISLWNNGEKITEELAIKYGYKNCLSLRTVISQKSVKKSEVWDSYLNI